MTSRHLDPCAVCAAWGREEADKMFGRSLPAGFDNDHPADQDIAAALADERERCDECLKLKQGTSPL